MEPELELISPVARATRTWTEDPAFCLSLPPLPGPTLASHGPAHRGPGPTLSTCSSWLSLEEGVRMRMSETWVPVPTQLLLAWRELGKVLEPLGAMLCSVGRMDQWLDLPGEGHGGAI